MKKFLCFAILLLIMKAIYSQEADSVRIKDGNRLSAGVIIEPKYEFRNLQLGDGSIWIDTLIRNNRNEREKYQFGFSAGVSVMYKLSRHFSLESGLLYSRKGYQMDLSQLVFGDMIDPRYGFIYQTQNGTKLSSWRYIYNYLDIPLRLCYFSNGRKFQFVSSAGFNVNIFINSYQKLGDVKSKLSSVAARLGLSGYVAAGTLYRLNEKIQFSLMPDFDYSITPLVNAGIREHLWSAGLKAGGFYNF